jgi:hypothetical protein
MQCARACPPMDIEEKTFDIGPNIQILHVFATKYRARYRRLVFNIEANTFNINVLPLFATCRVAYRVAPDIEGFRYRVAPDIDGFYSISVAIWNFSREISSIYRCQEPISNHFYSISNVSSINIFHILMSCTICDADIRYNVVLTC